MTPTGDRMFHPWRTPQGPAATALVENVEALISDHERLGRYRQRARRLDDQRRWSEMVSVLTSELALAALHPPASGRIVVPISYTDRLARYRNPAIGECLPQLLGYLSEMHLADVIPGTREGVQATTCSPTAKLSGLVAAHQVRVGDIGLRAERGDPIVLTRALQTGRTKTRRWIDYEDTETTRGLRAEMLAINRYLADLPLDFIPDGLSPVQTDDRWMTRRFVVRERGGARFDQCGRLFGGFWQYLSKSRRGSLHIAGEPVAVVDFNAAFARIAMAEQGFSFPGADLYAIPGLEGLSRRQIKTAMAVFFFTKPGMTRWPKTLDAIDPDTGEEVPGFPRKWTPKRVRDAIIRAHPSLEEALTTQAGDRLMLKESQIMVQVLLEMDQRGLAAVPIHDAVLVPQSAALPCAELLEGVSAMLVGQPVATTVTPRPLPL